MLLLLLPMSVKTTEALSVRKQDESTVVCGAESPFARAYVVFELCPRIYLQALGSASYTTNVLLEYFCRYGAAYRLLPPMHAAALRLDHFTSGTYTRSGRGLFICFGPFRNAIQCPRHCVIVQLNAVRCS